MCKSGTVVVEIERGVPCRFEPGMAAKLINDTLEYWCESALACRIGVEFGERKYQWFVALYWAAGLSLLLQAVLRVRLVKANKRTNRVGGWQGYDRVGGCIPSGEVQMQWNFCVSPAEILLRSACISSSLKWQPGWTATLEFVVRGSIQ